jgi:hypothetical protein
MRASTPANNSASNCTDDTNTGSGDRSASPPMCAGVHMVVLARVLSKKCQTDRAIRAIARVCYSDSNTSMVTVPVNAEQPRCFEARTLDKAHSRIWTIAKLWLTIQPKNGAIPSYAAANIAGATAFGRASEIRISPSVSRRCASVGLRVGALCACGKEGPSGNATRGRTGPATHTPKSLASLSWPSRPCRASGQPSCGKRLHRQQDDLGVAGSRADTGGGAYKRLGMRIARSDVGTRPSSRFPITSLQRKRLLRKLAEDFI